MKPLIKFIGPTNYVQQDGYLIEPSTSSSLPNGLSLQHSNSLTSLNSTTADDSAYKDRTNNEDYLRICLSCQKVLQRRYDQICFKNTQRDEVFVCYEKIVEAKINT
ncbi:unnamed protein product [Rotaria magnacalcarata]|uniref:Uncharacterized protein n=1 Tax=Rotaria magnacalcarata TaxID=392030 RepID=A0A816Y759_9BILA|nr:unnamed protein product [Rotaria magnacalcarata]